MPAKQLLDPAAENSAARLADDQTEVLQQATDLVLERGPYLNRHHELATASTLAVPALALFVGNRGGVVHDSHAHACMPAPEV